MADHPDPPCLTLARAIFDLLEESGATMTDQNAALNIVGTVIGAEYDATLLTQNYRRSQKEHVAPADEGLPRYLNVDARNPDPNRITAANPYGEPRAAR